MSDVRMTDQITFTCLDCAGELKRKDDHYICQSCAKNWPIRFGIPYFVREDFYWGNLSREEMNSLLESIHNSYWEDVVKEKIKTKHKELEAYIFDAQRASWHFFCSLNKDSSVLDIGGLWGTLSFTLAKTCGEVVAVDAVIENCRFMDVRRKQDHVENIQSVCANAVELPFAENTFDLVVLNGVLEWTGLADPNENPLVLHKKIVKKIHHILKPGGKLYIGIENRFGIDCLMGVKDSHSGLRFVTVLPRWLADIYSKRKRGHRYSEITHSYWGMKKLLRTSGFKRIEFFIPLPNYRYFAYFIPFNNNQGLRFCVNHFMKARLNEASGRIQLFFLLVRILIFFILYFLLKSFSPSFSLLAQKDS